MCLVSINFIINYIFLLEKLKKKYDDVTVVFYDKVNISPL